MEAAESIDRCDYQHECHDGPIEYKWKLVGKTEARIERLATQMNFRLGEGQGAAIYRIGVSDDGTAIGLSEADMKESIDTLHAMAALLQSTSSHRAIVIGPIAYKPGKQGRVAEVHVKRLPLKKTEKEKSYSNVRVCCLGDVNVGKSTLVGVLSRNTLDNGKGLARAEVFRYAHELEVGHTSSVTRHQLCFDEEGNVQKQNSLFDTDTNHKKGTTVTFVDLAGHTSYMKTTMFGLTSQCPDYSLVAVAADAIVVEPPAKLYCESLKCFDCAMLECRLCPTSWCVQCFPSHPCFAFRSIVSTKKGLPRRMSFSNSSPSPLSSCSSPFASSSPCSSFSCISSFASSPSSKRSPSPLSIPPLSRNSSMKKSSSSPSLSNFLSSSAFASSSAAAFIHTSLHDNVLLSRSISIPTFVVVTRTDVGGSEAHLHKVLAQVRFELGSASCLIKTEEEAKTLAKPSLNHIPVFAVSSVTGQNLHLLRIYLHHLRKAAEWKERAREEAEFDIDETYSLEDVGAVVSGTVMKGEITPNTTLFLGPHRLRGSYQEVSITSLHNNGQPTPQAIAGQAVTLALSDVMASELRKGMVLVPENLQVCFKGFDAQVSLLDQRFLITPGHEAVIYCRTTRQAARIESVEADTNSLGAKLLVRFMFCYSPEYLRVGSKLVFTDGQIRGVGTILNLISFDTQADSSHFQQKRRSRAHSESAKDR